MEGPPSNTTKAFLRHMRKFHSGVEKFQCEKCGKDLITKLAYFAHKRMCGKTIRCTVEGCFKWSDSEANMKAHMSTVHSVGSATGVGYHGLPDFKFEIITVDGVKKWVCDICGKHNRTRGNANRHRYSVHAVAGAPKIFRNFQCRCRYEKAV